MTLLIFSLVHRLSIILLSSLNGIFPISPLIAQECTNLGPVTDICVENGLRKQREILRAFPEYQTDTPEAHLKLAERLMQQGDPNGALEEYQAALRLKPEMTEAFRGLGAVYLDKHEWQNAQQALQKSTELNPHDHQALYWLGRSLIAQEHFREAREAFVAATQLDPDNPETHSDLGLALMAQGYHKEAEKALEKAITLQPDFAEAHHRLEQVRAAQHDSERLIHSAHDILHALFRRE